MSGIETSAALSDDVEAPYPSRRVATYATIMFAFLYWLSILDRFIISLLVDPIKRDLDITDMQFGLLHSTVFSITFSVFGLLAGAMADRASRRWIIYLSVTVWSLATAACGMVKSFGGMLVARIGVGAGEAGLNPCATSMIADLVPRDRLTWSMAIYAMGSSVGAGCAYLIGGVIVDLVAQAPTVTLPIVGAVRSWQAVFFIVGIPGALLSLLIFTVPEPVRRGTQQVLAQQSSFWRGAFGGYRDLLKFIRSRSRFFFFHYSGFTFAAMILAGSGAWYPAYMGRTFGWSSSQIGFSLGLTLVLSGIIGKLICGSCVDRMYRRGLRDAQIRWYAGCLLAAMPVLVIATTSHNPWVFLGGVGLSLILLAPLPACAVASLNLVTPNELRGAGVAFYSSISGTIGAGMGAVIVAGISDRFFQGGTSIGLGIAATAVICCPIGAALLICGCRAMRDAVALAERN
jgi:MFS family permease